MLATGNQLRAARALVGMEQAQLAEASGLHVNTIRKMEARGAAEITSGADNVRRVQAAMEAAGVRFVFEPGVRVGVAVARASSPDEDLRPDQLTTENDG